MSDQDLVLYNRSRVVRGIKQAMGVARRVMPRSLYDFVLNHLFSAYRCALRGLYVRHVASSWLVGDKRKLRKARTVLKVIPYSLVGTPGLEVTYEISTAAECKGIRGAVVECGVAQGGSAALMALVAKYSGNTRRLWLFDSFEGLPDPSDADMANGSTGLHIRELPPGSCLGTQEQVETLLFERFALDRHRITLVKGWFEDTLASHVATMGPVAILRIDADWYESVKCCLDNLYDSVVPGGYVIVDDYGSCFGARKAVDEFLEGRSLDLKLIHDGRGGASFTKPD